MGFRVQPTRMSRTRSRGSGAPIHLKRREKGATAQGMPKKTSAGLLLYKIQDERLLVLLGHMGGPFWAKKDQGAWSIPKGEYVAGQEETLDVAKREFQEELGAPAPSVEYHHLGSFAQPGGKIIDAWTACGDFDASAAVSNTFQMEWPKNSGTIREFPEIDRASWFDVTTAKQKVPKGQAPILARLISHLATKGISVSPQVADDST